MEKRLWQESNRLAIMRRLHWLSDQPQGPIHHRQTTLHNIAVHKVGTQIRLFFIDPTAEEIMSRMDLTNPLYLLALYTRAMMLGLVWWQHPRRVYAIGFGGGRVPMLLHHYFPDVTVESTDIEPAVKDIAERFFGVAFDDRLRIAIEDGRDYLTNQPSSYRYDMIMLDGFRGNGYGPYRFSTLEFYHLCKKHLTEGGVILANILEGDQLYLDKIRTFCAAFSSAYLYRREGADVLIGTDSSEITKEEIAARAAVLDEEHGFEFALLHEAIHVLTRNELFEQMPGLEQARTLTDVAPPPGYFESLSPLSTVFAKADRNDPCPCGSGKKFKRCHGPIVAKIHIPPINSPTS